MRAGLPLTAIVILAVITLSLRLAGHLLPGRIQVPEPVSGLVTTATAVLLLALAATGALTQGHSFAGWARPAGVAAAGLLAVTKAPFPLVVIAAVAVTALLRLAGVS